MIEVSIGWGCKLQSSKADVIKSLIINAYNDKIKYCRKGIFAQMCLTYKRSHQYSPPVDEQREWHCRAQPLYLRPEMKNKTVFYAGTKT